ncbi:MAG: glycoside hydrolase family 5 protein, partial [Deltaproteobacteria bacterium]|nr:glycoside hydrolase family 5 protein [Deltaproteobacteria bacterium]
SRRQDFCEHAVVSSEFREDRRETFRDTPYYKLMERIVRRSLNYIFSLPFLFSLVSCFASNSESWRPPTEIDPKTPVGMHGQLRVEGRQIIDAHGNPIQLKGMSTMWLNWESRFATNKKGLQWMRDHWGLTVYRAALGVISSGGQMQSTTTNEQYVRKIVHNAIDLGVYVIIDWHDHNAHLHTTAAKKVFTEMAQEFGEFPHVIYETFNEPQPFDDERNFVQWSTHIKPYHEEILAAIRAIDPDNIVIFGNPQWSQRPDIAAADPVVGDNIMYSLHFYSCTHGDEIRGYADAAINSGATIFVTEWGATNADGGLDGKVCLDQAQQWLDWMDEKQISWAAWKLDGCSDATCIFASKYVSAKGNWSENQLHGHGPFVVERMQK